MRLAIAASIVAHVGFAAALVINAAWRISKLEIHDPELAIAALGLPSSAPPALSGEKKEKPVIEIEKFDDIAQKNDATENHDEASASDVGSPDGHADGIGDSQGNTVGAPDGKSSICPSGNCIKLDDLAPPPKPKPEPPRIVANEVIKGYKTSGEDQIHPSTKIKSAINRSSSRKVHGIVYVCISTSGRVVSAKLSHSTGYGEYDAKLLAGVRRWIYRPYKISGKAIQVCTAINFIYRLTD